MSVTIKIHRGTDQIGGTITEIYTENTHIFIDFGSELSVTKDKSTDANMVKMINRTKYDAVLFTHYHGDHIGLMGKIPEKDIREKQIRLCMGEVSRDILRNIHKTLLKNPKINETERAEHEHILQILDDKKRWKNLSEGKSFEIGDFKITPVNVDHSAYNAFLFIIESEGKCIVHTGDFRTHGRLGRDLFERLSKHLEGRRVDVLLTEGTMMSRLSEKVLTEEELEKKAIKELEKPENKYAFLVCSSTNVESLASFHNAALKLKRPFIVNYYVYEQIQLYKKSAGVNNAKFKLCKTYKFEPMEEFNPKLGSTQPEYMKEKGFVMLVGTSDTYTERMECFRQNDPLLIYSMWSGYLDENNLAFDPKLKALYDKWPRHNTELHTSGHAYKEDIEEMIRLVNPVEAIIPMHTEKKSMFSRLDIGDLQGKVCLLSDGECYVVGEKNN